MFFVILRIVRTEKRTGCSYIKYKMENISMSKIKHDILKSNLKILEWMNEISIAEETY